MCQVYFVYLVYTQCKVPSLYISPAEVVMNRRWETEAAVLVAGRRQGSEEVVEAEGVVGAAEMLTSAATVCVKIRRALQ